MKIGTFIQDRNGIMHGKIHGLGFGVISVMFEAQTSREGKPYFRIIADPARNAYEVGAAFEKQKDGMTYHSVCLESPAFMQPLNAALFPDRDTGNFNLVWDRPLQASKLEARADGAQPSRKYLGANASP